MAKGKEKSHRKRASTFLHQLSRHIIDVWDQVEDMTEAFRKMQEEGPEPEENDQEEDS